MFDWDADYDEVVAGGGVIAPVMSPSFVEAEPEGKLAAWAGRLRGLAHRAALPVVVALCLATTGAGALLLPTQSPTQLLAMLADVPDHLLGRGDAVMPQGLRTYDQARYDNFRRGIRRFSDADLLAYVAATESTLGPAAGPMTDYALDALFLAQREVDRRGLVRPIASLRQAFNGS